MTLKDRCILCWCDWICWRVSGGSTEDYIVAVITGNKMRIMILMLVVLVLLDKVLECSLGALLAYGMGSLGAFVAYGLSDAAHRGPEEL